MISMISIVINVKSKVVCFDCCGEAHLKLCSNTACLGSILYFLGLKDYSLTEQSEKHVNNLVGLHSARSLWHTGGERESERPTQCSLVCMNQTMGQDVRQNHMLARSLSNPLSLWQTHTDCRWKGRDVIVEAKNPPIKLQGTIPAGPDRERHPMLWIPVQPPRYTCTPKQSMEIHVRFPVEGSQ